jgi:hypothetical protein
MLKKLKLPHNDQNEKSELLIFLNKLYATNMNHG